MRIPTLTRPQQRTLLILSAVALLGTYSALRAGTKKPEVVGVGLTGVHHLGYAYNISEFYVNGYDGGNVGREGGGGSTVCCVVLPKKWRAGLVADVRWSINDWSKENTAELDAGNYRSIGSGGIYRAKVPVERYDTPGQFWVHFFPNGRVRVVSTDFGPGGPRHPIQDDDKHAGDRATQGILADQIFTTEELAEMARKTEESRKKYGDWR